MWETPGGEAVCSRVGAAIFVPVVLLVTGLHQASAQAGTDRVRPIKVVRVTKVVKVVQHAPVQRPEK